MTATSNPDLNSKGRRLFLGSMAAAAAGAVSAQSDTASGEVGSDRESRDNSAYPGDSPDSTAKDFIANPKIAMVVHPKMVVQDLVGPWTVFNLIQGAEIHLVWKDLEPVSTELGLFIPPTTTLADCPADLDVLFVPGGLEGSILLMDDEEVLDFLRDRGERARYVTSVCTGSLVLGAAGLLRGYRATGHWYIRDLLKHMGATPVNERVVMDRNRITGGGVTAGIDFGLTLAALLRGRDSAEQYQLILEYAPAPPFNAGTPETAPESARDFVMTVRGPVIELAREKAIEIGAAFEAG